MFRNRAIQVSLVKTNKHDVLDVETSTVNPEQIKEIYKEMLKSTGIAIGVTFAASFVLHAAIGLAVRAIENK